MDSTGKIITQEEFLKNLGVVLQPATDKMFSIAIESYEGQPGYNDGKVCFNRSFKQSGVMSNVGCVNLKTRSVIEGPFDHGTSLHFFDPVSKLAHARFNVSRNSQDKVPLRDGYVNEQGIFVIVKGEASKW
jgi:hypothetical protein